MSCPCVTPCQRARYPAGHLFMGSGTSWELWGQQPSDPSSDWKQLQISSWQLGPPNPRLAPSPPAHNNKV